MYSDDMDDHRLRVEFELRLYDLLGPGEMSRQTIRRLEWVRLNWELPSGVSKDVDVVDPVFKDYWPGTWCPLSPKRRLTHIDYSLLQVTT